MFKFLYLITGQVTAVRRMGHFHLSADRDAELALLLAPFFDATIELAPSERGVKQRRHLRESGLSTGWLEL